MRSIIVLSLLALLPLWGPGCAARQGVQHRAAAEDPASQDLRSFDAEHPPLLVEARFIVEGASLNAIVYEAQGVGPHPTVVLLHGFPGNERNLDLAQAIRRAGWNVVFFHYRGAWGSGGRFSFAHLLEDVAAVVGAISEPDFAAAHRIDPDRIALVGHSMGGFAALVSGAELASVDCIVSLAGANLGALASGIEADPAVADRFAARLDSWSGPIKGPAGRELVAEIIEQRDRFDTTRSAAPLASKHLLLIAGADDGVTSLVQNHTPLVDALRSVGAGSLEEMVIPRADHSFSGQRIALARIVSRWLVETCESSR